MESSINAELHVEPQSAFAEFRKQRRPCLEQRVASPVCLMRASPVRLMVAVPARSGVSTQLVPLPEAMRTLIEPLGGHVPRSGLMVVSVQPGTSADRGGILLGDLLVGLGGDPMEDPRDVFAALGPDTVGREMQATLVRAGQPLKVTLTIDEHPERG